MSWTQAQWVYQLWIYFRFPTISLSLCFVRSRHGNESSIGSFSAYGSKCCYSCRLGADLLQALRITVTRWSMKPLFRLGVYGHPGTYYNYLLCSLPLPLHRFLSGPYLKKRGTSIVYSGTQLGFSHTSSQLGMSLKVPLSGQFQLSASFRLGNGNTTAGFHFVRRQPLDIRRLGSLTFHFDDPRSVISPWKCDCRSQWNSI